VSRETSAVSKRADVSTCYSHPPATAQQPRRKRLKRQKRRKRNFYHVFHINTYITVQDKEEDFYSTHSGLDYLFFTSSVGCTHGHWCSILSGSFKLLPYRCLL